MTGRVLVVGSVNVDLVATVERLPAPGETVTDAAFARHPGGKGGNQATAAARLGAAVTFIGAVGDDPLADEASAALTREGVDLTELARLPGPTGVALILVDAGGENLIAVASGANGGLTPERVVAALSRLAPGPADVVVVGCEIPSATARAALEGARARGARTVLNPAPAGGVDAGMLAATDILVPNRIELADLSAGSVGADDDVPGQARGLLDPADSAGVALAVVTTLGSAGATLIRRDGSAVDLPAPRVEPVDAVGAGDTFVGALAADLAAGRELVDAATRAVAAASLSTTRRGARGGMPSSDELEAFLARH
jgi:ribokinase